MKSLTTPVRTAHPTSIYFPRRVCRAHQISGFSHIEVLIATVLMTISLLPAMDALKTGLLGSVIHRESVEIHYHLQAKLEQVLAEPVSLLETAAVDAADPAIASSYSEAPGTNRRRLVYISRYDGDDQDGDHFTDTDAGLIWVRVELEGTALSVETLITQAF